MLHFEQWLLSVFFTITTCCCCCWWRLLIKAKLLWPNFTNFKGTWRTESAEKQNLIMMVTYVRIMIISWKIIISRQNYDPWHFFKLCCLKSKVVCFLQLIQWIIYNSFFWINWFMLVQGTSGVVGVEPITIMIIIVVIIKDSFGSHDPLCTSPCFH